MTGLYDDALIGALSQGARDVAPGWGLPPETSVELLTISENATFLARPPGGNPVILRVHRPGYHTQAEIESELAWIAALRAEGIVETPEPLPCVDGGHVATFPMDGEDRAVVAFAFMAGREPSPTDDLTAGFHKLGAISARLARSQPPLDAPRWVRAQDLELRHHHRPGTTLGRLGAPLSA